MLPEACRGSIVTAAKVGKLTQVHAAMTTSLIKVMPLLMH